MEIEEVKNFLENSVKYPVVVEIEGKFAMWSRPDTGSEKTTEIIPSFSAAKGVFESILYMPSVWVIPYKVEICNQIEYNNYAFNYLGVLRKSGLIKNDNACQIRTTILRNPIYRLYAFAINNKDYKSNNVKYQNINHAHSYQAQFNRRITKGRNFRKTFLGWSEFMVSYAGVCREKTEVRKDINYTIPSMVFSCFDKLNNGVYNPSYLQNVEVRNGVAYYVK